MDPSDHDLVEKFRTGDQEGFNALWNRHAVPIFKYLFLSLRNWDDALESSQDVALAFSKAVIAEGYDLTQSHLAYLQGIARNTALMKKRSRARNARKEKENTERILKKLEIPSKDYRQETVQELVSALDDLGDVERALIEMKYLEGHTLEEMGALLELPKTTIASRLNAIKSKLRTRVESALAEWERTDG